MSNLEIYNAVKEVPQNAQKSIQAGRLKGMTDINPMWRIEKLTETFGVCGIGWYYDILNKEIIRGANEEQVAVVDIALYIKNENEWSKPIYGTGGSSFVAKESKGLYTNDECYKMALTDALSVACKSLGFGADVYWNKSDSKYQKNTNIQNENNKNIPNTNTQTFKTITVPQQKRLFALANNNNAVVKNVINRYKYEKTEQIKISDYEQICKEIEAELLY